LHVTLDVESRFGAETSTKQFDGQAEAYGLSTQCQARQGLDEMQHEYVSGMYAWHITSRNPCRLEVDLLLDPANGSIVLVHMPIR